MISVRRRLLGAIAGVTVGFMTTAVLGGMAMTNWWLIPFEPAAIDVLAVAIFFSGMFGLLMWVFVGFFAIFSAFELTEQNGWGLRRHAIGIGAATVAACWTLLFLTLGGQVGVALLAPTIYGAISGGLSGWAAWQAARVGRARRP